MPIGRPTTYKAAYCGQVIELGALGKSEVQISAAIGHPRTTMRSWAEQNPEFSSALTRAKELEQAWWEDKGQEGLADRTFNAPLWAKNVASRFRADYGDRVVTEHTGKDGGPIQTEDVSARDILTGRIAGLSARLEAASGPSKPH